MCLTKFLYITHYKNTNNFGLFSTRLIDMKAIYDKQFSAIKEVK